MLSESAKAGTGSRDHYGRSVSPLLDEPPKEDREPYQAERALQPRALGGAASAVAPRSRQWQRLTPGTPPFPRGRGPARHSYPLTRGVGRGDRPHYLPLPLPSTLGFQPLSCCGRPALPPCCLQ